ncbi:MAG TPA: caspase family protein [Thermoanaerobaculia bacterium]|nr:caspase family protein [Thermoanaerobaculia bacterium]
MRLQTWVGVCLIAATAWAGDETWRSRGAGKSAPDEQPKPVQKDSETITFELPSKLTLLALPERPLDDQLRVALILPTAEAEQRSHWFYWTDLSKQSYTRVNVSHAPPVAGVLPTVLSRLFPRIKIVDQPPEGAAAEAYDLVLHMHVRASSMQTAEGVFSGVLVQGTLTATRPDGSAIAAIEASGEGKVTKSMYWSAVTRARAVGTPAIEHMLDDLVTKLIADPKLGDFLGEHAAARARPSQLETTFRLDDETSILPNGRLDAGESAKLVFTVRNRGAGQAFGARLRLSAPQRELTFPAEANVGDVLPGAEASVTVPITASLAVQSEAVQLHIETSEKRGYGGRPVVARIATERLHPPTLEIADVALGAGRPANGETVEALVVVRNSGPGAAVGGALHVSAEDPRISIVEPTLWWPPIAVDDAAQARVHIRVPVTYDAGSIALTLRAVEARGESVAEAKRSVVWQMDFRRPAVEVAYRLYDGNSVGSKGNRDGVANSGEQLELVLTAVNRGALAAREVQLALKPLDAGIALQPDRLMVGDLPPKVEAPEQRVVIHVPRTTGRDASLQALSFAVTATQRDFEPRETRIELAFAQHRPDLVLALAEVSPLLEGGSSTISLDVRNQGLLAAERVQIEVTSASAAVDLLDERGAPVSRRVIDAGTIAPRTALPPIDLNVHVKRTTAAGEALLKVVARQQDFAVVTREAALRIEPEAPAVITVDPPAPRPERRDRPTPVQASVAFRRYEEGERVAGEAIDLRFEVQSASRVERVRLEHNGRVIALQPPRLLPGQGGRLLEYEQRIDLDYGANLFEVVVVTEEGLRSSRTLTLHRDRPDGRIWLAVVGISDYAGDSVNDLAFARKDAAAVAAYYSERFGIDEGQIIQLLDEQATLANIKRRLGTELVARALNPNDTVIIYFAGHGLKERDRASADADGFTKYILPYDADPGDLFSTALSMEQLALILQRLRPERVALILDSCFSGAAEGGRTLFDPAVRTRGIVTDEFLSRLAGAGKGRIVLTASGANEIALERRNFGHGVFTYFFLEGLRGAADDDRDGQVDVDEIYKYVSRKVSAETRGSQHPMKKASSQTGIVVLGRTSVRAQE